VAKGSGKSGKQVAEEHVATLVDVLARYAAAGKPLPRFQGELNRSALAAECRFDRKVFTTNPRCQELLRKADEEDRKCHLSALDQAELIREQEAKTDEERARLEARVLALEAENYRLKAEVRRFKAIEDLMLDCGKLP
jgi:hypothetical protein